MRTVGQPKSKWRVSRETNGKSRVYNTLMLSVSFVTRNHLRINKWVNNFTLAMKNIAFLKLKCVKKCRIL